MKHHDEAAHAYWATNYAEYLKKVPLRVLQFMLCEPDVLELARAESKRRMSDPSSWPDLPSEEAAQ